AATHGRSNSALHDAPPLCSNAIFAIVSPNTFVWSREIEVITHTSGQGIMLVESKRPPSPTSITAMSQPASLKYNSAAAVIASNRSEEHTSELQSRFELVCR